MNAQLDKKAKGQEEKRIPSGKSDGGASVGRCFSIWAGLLYLRGITIGARSALGHP
jgi:hypothetical protein